MLKHLFYSYPYLFGTLFFMVPLFIVVYGLFPDQRKNFLLSSTLAMPQAITSLVLIPEYWNPKRILVIGIGPEDLLFMFIVGGVAWIENVLIFRKRIITEIRVDILVPRYVLHNVFFFVIFLVLKETGMHYMDIAFLAMFFWMVIMLLWRPRLWPMAMMGSLISFFLYVSFFLVGNMVWPAFLSDWKWENLWGLRLGPLPLEEVVWAVLYSPTWGLTMAFMLNAEIAAKPRAGQANVGKD